MAGPRLGPICAALGYGCLSNASKYIDARHQDVKARIVTSVRRPCMQTQQAYRVLGMVREQSMGRQGISR